MSSGPVEQSPRSPLILVIDDHAPVRFTLEHILKRRGYRVICADSGPCGIVLAASERIDAMLIDVHMPGMTGLECLRIIQKNRTADAPEFRVWFMSGAPTAEMARAAAQLGALGLLQKPFEYPELLATLKAGLASPLPQRSTPE
ncbi:MAG: response regulator [Opitutus sp.]